MKNEKGFTLIEMMVVMLIISVLLIITIPNITKHNSNINDKGCEAYVKMIQSQVQAYEVEHHAYPASVDDLVADKYLNDTTPTCPDGKTTVKIGADGAVSTISVP